MAEVSINVFPEGDEIDNILKSDDNEQYHSGENFAVHTGTDYATGLGVARVNLFEGEVGYYREVGSGKYRQVVHPGLAVAGRDLHGFFYDNQEIAEVAERYLDLEDEV